MIQQSTNLFHDPELPQLGIVTDPAAMAERFAKQFCSALAPSGWQVESCAVEWLQHRRGRRCRLLYRTILRDVNGKKFDQWFFGKIFRRPTQSRREYEQALAGGPWQNGLWPPVTLWPDIEMVVWAFPNDPDMPGLRQAADPVCVQARLNSNLAVLGLSEAWRCEQVVLERVKYMPGKRCVLRCEARLENSSGESRRASFYSKTYSDGKSRLHFDNLQAFQERLGNQINVPRPLACWDETNTFWQESWEGRPLIDALDKFDWEDLFPRLAGVLAAFHQSHCEALPQVDALERAFDSAQEDAPMLGWLLPQQRSRFDKALAAIAAAKETVARQPAPVAPTHGTMRIEQILARDHETALVDFDAAALSDPLYDVAEFLISLQFLEFSHGFPPHRLAMAAELFKTSYAKQVSWQVDPQRVAWYAAISLLDKLHESLRNLDGEVMQKFDSILEIMEFWIDGLVE